MMPKEQIDLNHKIPREMNINVLSEKKQTPNSRSGTKATEEADGFVHSSSRSQTKGKRLK